MLFISFVLVCLGLLVAVAVLRTDRARLKEQWTEQSIVIGLTVLLFLIGLYFTIGSWYQTNTPLFKYTYDPTNETISVDTGSNFSPVLTTWFIPEGDSSSSTGLIQSSLRIQDITNVLLDTASSSLIIPGPLDNYTVGYLQCEILNQFGLQGSTTPQGFPIGVRIGYVTEGSTNVRWNNDIILLSNFDNPPLQIYTIPDVTEWNLKTYLDANGNKELQQMLKRNPYDPNSQYLDNATDSPLYQQYGTPCEQITTSSIEIPLDH